MNFQILLLLSTFTILTRGYVVNKYETDHIQNSRHVSNHNIFHKHKPSTGEDSSSEQPNPLSGIGSSITSAQIPFGQYGFFPSYVQPVKGPPSYMASYPNFDYINVLRPGLENLLFSPNPIYLTPIGDVWTGIENENIPVVWKPINDYPFGSDGNQPYREIKSTLENWSSKGFPVHILEKLIENIKQKKEKKSKKY